MPNYFPRGTQGDIPGSQTQAQLLEARRQLRYVQQSIPRTNTYQGQAGMFIPCPFPGVYMAIVNSALTACTVNGNTLTPGTGTCDIYYMDDTNSNTAKLDPDRKNIPLLNWYVNSGNTNSNTHITVCQSGNVLVLLGADC